MNRNQRRAEQKQARNVDLAPTRASALFATAVSHHQAGRLAEAEAHYRQVLAIDSGHAPSYHFLGALAYQIGRDDIAAAMIGRAIELNGADAAYHCSLGDALKRQGKLGEAVASYRRGLALKPDFAMCHNNLGNALKDLGEVEDAVASYRRAIGLSPAYANAHYNLGYALMQQGRLGEAADCYQRALALKPDFVQAHNNLGIVREEQGRLTEAMACYERAAALTPSDDAIARNNIGGLLREQGRIDEAIASYERALALYPDYIDAHSNLLMTQHYSDKLSNDDLLAAARRFGLRFDGKTPARAFLNDRDPGRRLRIGYVSGDFRQHPVGYFLANVLEAHDGAAVETFCYSNSGKSDDTTDRLRSAAGHWRSVVGVSDAAAAAMIIADRIDILVDLSGHTGGNRLPMFALRPAPVQASWLGYFGATGLGTIDYLLMDEGALPSGQDDRYREAILRLPHGRFCYAPPAYAPAPTAPPSLERGWVTFGSFNNIAKIGPDTIDLWAGVLRATPESRLLLKWRSLDNETTRRRVAAAFEAAGVAGSRLELRGFSPHAAMLAQYSDVDIALDPVLFGGGLTSCEALWMGLPVVTLPGERPASRQTVGFLNSLKLTECVARSPRDYIERAAALAANPAWLAGLRRTLRPSMAASPLCDGELFTPTLEEAYRQMWMTWSAGVQADEPYDRA